MVPLLRIGGIDAADVAVYIGERTIAPWTPQHGRQVRRHRREVSRVRTRPRAAFGTVDDL